MPANNNSSNKLSFAVSVGVSSDQFCQVGLRVAETLLHQTPRPDGDRATGRVTNVSFSHPLRVSFNYVTRKHSIVTQKVRAEHCWSRSMIDLPLKQINLNYCAK